MCRKEGSTSKRNLERTLRKRQILAQRVEDPVKVCLLSLNSIKGHHQPMIYDVAAVEPNTSLQAEDKPGSQET